jgi:hypothetical protein
LSSAPNSFSRLRCGLRFRSAAELGQRQQLAQQRDIFIIPRPRREKRPQFAELLLDRVVASEAGGAFELGDEGVQRAVLMMRRAEIPQARMGLGSDVLRKRDREPRLANARFAGNRHHPTFTALRLLPAADKQLDFLLTPDERRFPRAQRLEPAYLVALAQHSPSVLRQGEAGELLRPEILQIEQPADLPACRFANDQRIRRGQGLQPGGEVRRLADDPALLCGALANQIANHGEPGGDAEPHAQSFLCRQLTDRIDHRQPGAHRPLGIVLMRSWVNRNRSARRRPCTWRQSRRSARLSC